MNILLIMADQFAAHALERSRTTDAHFSTPNLDRLAAHSTRFSQAYTPFPLCVPARSAMITGKYPHQLGVMANTKAGGAPAPEPGHGPQSLGHWFAAAGYDCAYAGKWHALQASATEQDGFAPIHPFGDEGLVEACHQWLANRPGANPANAANAANANQADQTDQADQADQANQANQANQAKAAPNSAGSGRDRPFFLVASFDDPHTICEYARSQPMPYGDVPTVPLAQTPPLPANFPAVPFAPVALSAERNFAARVYGSIDYTPEDWRHYRHNYAALVARVDRRIGLLLDGIDLASTAVVLVSDHGDGDAAHGWNQKTALFQECIRVPFLVHVPGQDAAVVDTPVPAVLGLLPTLCDIVGIPAPDGLAVGSVLALEPESVVVQTVFADAAALPGAGTSGRAIISGRWKYTVYSWGRHREQLHDLRADPGEQRNLAVEALHEPVLERMRAELLRWTLAHHDTAFMKKLVLPSSADPQIHREVFAVPY